MKDGRFDLSRSTINPFRSGLVAARNRYIVCEAFENSSMFFGRSRNWDIVFKCERRRSTASRKGRKRTRSTTKTSSLWQQCNIRNSNWRRETTKITPDGDESFRIVDQVKNNAFNVTWPPQAENITAFVTKHYASKHDRGVRPWYSHKDNSPTANKNNGT